MKKIALSLLVLITPYVSAEITTLSDNNFHCETTGGFFDFSPNGAISSCKEEIVQFCESQGAPPVIEKVVGHPSGPARYARAEISFQCISAEGLAQKNKAAEDKKIHQLKEEIQVSKQLCEQEFGFTLGTPDFGSCVLELQKQNFSNKRTEQQILAKKESDEAVLTQQRQLEADRNNLNALQNINNFTANQSINCTSHSIVGTTYTNCR